MLAAIDEQIKRNVIQQWISGYPRDKITVISIVNNYKIGIGNSDFESVTELAVDAKKQGLDLADLASHFRLYNFIRKSGAAEEAIESFISKIQSSQIPQEKIIDYVNQLFDISKSETIPLEEVTSYIKQKLEEKKKIDGEIQQADSALQSKNMSIEAINEHTKLNEELNKHGLSAHDIPRLLNLLLNAKEYGFDAKKIVGKLRSIKRLENKENRLKNNCDILLKADR
jgi:hypothetical protein